MDQERRSRLTRQALAWTLTVAAALLVWWATSDDDSGGDGRQVGRVPSTSAGSTTSEPGVPTDSTASTSTPTGDAATDPVSGLAWIAETELPPEALDTLDEIDAGPPYPYDRDGITFENREGLLPDEETGYYQEFTVETPGSADRGARRIIWGLDDEFYYTDDHYASFRRIGP